MGGVSQVDRAAVGLGAGAAAATLLAVPKRTPWHLVGLGGVGYTAVLLLAALAIAGGLSRLRLVVALAGLGFWAVAILQLVQLSGGHTNTLGGDLSTVSLCGGFAVGLLVLGLARRE
jgi:hypothetical protein